MESAAKLAADSILSKKVQPKVGLFCEEMVKWERVREDAGARETRARDIGNGGYGKPGAGGTPAAKIGSGGSGIPVPESGVRGWDAYQGQRQHEETGKRRDTGNVKAVRKGTDRLVNADREAHGKKPFDDGQIPPPPKRSRTTPRKKAGEAEERGEKTQSSLERDRSGQRSVCKGKPQAVVCV